MQLPHGEGHSFVPEQYGERCAACGAGVGGGCCFLSFILHAATIATSIHKARSR